MHDGKRRLPRARGALQQIPLFVTRHSRKDQRTCELEGKSRPHPGRRAKAATRTLASALTVSPTATILLTHMYSRSSRPSRTCLSRMLAICDANHTQAHVCARASHEDQPTGQRTTDQSALTTANATILAAANQGAPLLRVGNPSPVCCTIFTANMNVPE